MPLPRDTRLLLFFPVCECGRTAEHTLGSLLRFHSSPPLGKATAVLDAVMDGCVSPGRRPQFETLSIFAVPKEKVVFKKSKIRSEEE